MAYISCHRPRGEHAARSAEPLGGQVNKRRPILIGYDESPESEKALCWAVQEALLGELPILVCHAWQWPHPHRPVEQEA